MKNKTIVFTPLQKKIIDAWLKLKLVHPSYEELSRKFHCSTQTAHKAVRKYQESLKLDKHGTKPKKAL